MKAEHKLPVVGLALGSGSARGWSHIGIILELEALGVRPQVVAGTSVGALVGAVYVAGQLNEFAEWVGKLTMRDVRSEEHTSELQSLMRISYAVFCLKKKNNKNKTTTHVNCIHTK